MKSDYFSQVQHRKHCQLQKHYQEVGKRNHWFDQKKKTFRLYFFSTMMVLHYTGSPKTLFPTKPNNYKA